MPHFREVNPLTGDGKHFLALYYVIIILAMCM